MTDCQITEPFAECGPVQTMRHNADFWYRLCQREKKKREQLEREADWLAKILSVTMGHDDMPEDWREAARKAVEEDTNDK